MIKYLARWEEWRGLYRVWTSVLKGDFDHFSVP